MWAVGLVLLAAAPLRVSGAAHEVDLREGEHTVVRACAAAPTDRCVAPPAKGLRWYELVALAGDYDNTGSRRTIAYRWREIARDTTTLHVPELAALAALGTHRLAVTTGPAPPLPRGPADVVRLFTLVVRQDDSYVGYCTELIGVPFVLLPRWIPGIGHQTDARLGADCVALVIYGRRRMGERVPYMAPSRLHEVLILVGHVRSLAKGAPGIAVRVGDVLHFGFQTAVLARDEPPKGVLGPNDVIIHTFHALAEERRLGDVPYAGRPFDVMRWPDWKARRSTRGARHRNADAPTGRAGRARGTAASRGAGRSSPGSRRR